MRDRYANNAPAIYKTAYLSVVEDMIFDACLEANIHSLEDVNQFLLAYECRPFVPQT